MQNYLQLQLKELESFMWIQKNPKNNQPTKPQTKNRVTGVSNLAFKLSSTDSDLNLLVLYFPGW